MRYPDSIFTVESNAFKKSEICHAIVSCFAKAKDSITLHLISITSMKVAVLVEPPPKTPATNTSDIYLAGGGPFTEFIFPIDSLHLHLSAKSVKHSPLLLIESLSLEPHTWQFLPRSAVAAKPLIREQA
jgi:hypothetical protein